MSKSMYGSWYCISRASLHAQSSRTASAGNGYAGRRLCAGLTNLRCIKYDGTVNTLPTIASIQWRHAGATVYGVTTRSWSPEAPVSAQLSLDGC